MSNMRVKCHPVLGILVGTDGHVMVPQNGACKAHWTFGTKKSDGYRIVEIDGKVYRVHRLVAETFIPNPENKPQVDHISRRKDQNSVDNLRWATPSENMRNMTPHDRVTERGGTHVYEDEKQYHHEKWARCRAEHPEKLRERNARYYAKNKDKILEKQARYRAEHPEKGSERQTRYKQTHRPVRFADGKTRWICHADAILLLAIPLKERHYAK